MTGLELTIYVKDATTKAPQRSVNSTWGISINIIISVDLDGVG